MPTVNGTIYITSRKLVQEYSSTERGEGFMKKKIVVIMFTVAALSLVGCSSNGDSASNSSYDNSYTTNDDSDSDSSYSSSSSSSSSSYDDSDSDYSSSYSSDSSSSSSSSSSVEHYCDASGCTKEGTKVVTGLSGDPEYYCQEHYDEMQSIISDMEEDVGSGSYSTHKCEECSKEGTHELTGLDGSPEYYCTEHYNQLVDIVNELYGN